MKIIFLHGIGDGDPDLGWLDGLNRGLMQAGFVEVDRRQVIAPRYSSYLSTDGIAAKLPPVTYNEKDDSRFRREFERRQARVQRELKLDGAVRGFGFHRVPDPALAFLQASAVDKLPMFDIPQVKRYMSSESLRGAILRYILDHLPSNGDVIIIGHSLGSVVAIDLLDHLPAEMHVRRFITVGSPANMKALHEGSERLLKKFPYSRVDDWSNFFDVRDVVPGGRGLASTFPGAQDFVIDIKGSHGAGKHLGHASVARLIGDMLYPREGVAVQTSDVALRMNDDEASMLLTLHFAHVTQRHIKDRNRAERYRDALRLIQDDLVAQLERVASSGGRPVCGEVLELIRGSLPSLPHRWELHELVAEFVVLALTNVIEPYEIDVEKAPMLALPDMAVELGFRRDIGATVGKAVADVQEHLDRRGGVPWGRVLTAAAGVALVAAGPVGLAVAAPASAFGAAAITGGLAAFGPGGMVGGLAMLGGLAGTGAAVAASAAAGGGSHAEPRHDPTKLVLRVATEHARKMLDLSYDEGLWYQLGDFETEVSGELNRLSTFCDPKSLKLKQLEAGKRTILQLMAFMVANGLGPLALEQGVEAGGTVDISAPNEITAAP